VSDLAEAFRLLHSDPARSEQLCRQALRRGDDPGARLLLAAALRLQGDAAGAFEITRPLALENPNWPGAQYEHALALAGLERHAEALERLNKLAGQADLPGLWRAIGDQYWAMGDRRSAEQEYLRHLETRQFEPLVHEALASLQRKDRDAAERLLKRQLELFPDDVLAQRHLAEIYSAADRFEDAEALLHALLERAPSFALARFGLASVLLHDHRLPPALEQIDQLVASDPGRREYLQLKAKILGRLGRSEEAAACTETILSAHPGDALAWIAYGHFLRMLGRRGDCERAYRKAIALNPGLGEAYWGLANLKTFQFDAADIAAMRQQAERVDAENRASLLFALGKALEDAHDYEGAFEAYSRANAEHRGRTPYDAEERPNAVRRARTVYTPEFFAARAGVGSPADDPIFIVGMPRSGSTLVEQILASHSSVEGTMELIELLAMVRKLRREGEFPEMLREAPPARLRALGEEYLQRSRAFRRTDAPRFLDKMPNNFSQVGLIQLILPNARIIDVRRNPLACCLSIFKMQWATGQTFAYGLEDIGAYYRSYVDLMTHFDAALPGRVHRVIYENLVADTETEVRRLLHACGLPFEEQCLRFYENKRTVLTPSSEQVRQPIYTAGLESWRPFEPWLEPLKRALGPVLDAYPEAPPL
jgi:tetratricopeptide (TPR) repeat protein